jgi:hypothetical protein
MESDGFNKNSYLCSWNIAFRYCLGAENRQIFKPQEQ